MQADSATDVRVVTDVHLRDVTTNGLITADTDTHLLIPFPLAAESLPESSLSLTAFVHILACSQNADADLRHSMVNRFFLMPTIVLLLTAQRTVAKEGKESLFLSMTSFVATYTPKQYPCAVQYNVQRESKKSPLRTCGNFSQTVGYLSTKFYTPITRSYLRESIRIFIQLTATLTKLCHIKRDHPVHIMCAKCPPSAETHTGIF